jgi:hypothetical protein
MVKIVNQEQPFYLKIKNRNTKDEKGNLVLPEGETPKKKEETRIPNGFKLPPSLNMIKTKSVLQITSESFNKASENKVNQA